MNLCLVPVQSQRVQLDLLQLAGGATDSIFPIVEEWLNATVDHWNALREIARRKKDVGFHSVVDFVLVSLQPELRRKCLAFYSGDGKPLRELITEPERQYYERRLMVFLEVSYAAFSTKRRLSWTAARELVDELEVA